VSRVALPAIRLTVRHRRYSTLDISNLVGWLVS
jgi:hypothetical protein